MAWGQGSSVRVRRQGSSGYLWDDEMLSAEEEPNQSWSPYDVDQGDSQDWSIQRDPPSSRDLTCGLYNLPQGTLHVGYIHGFHTTFSLIKPMGKKYFF